MSDRKITDGVRRALEAVHRGDVWHVYRVDGNVYRGGHAATIRRLELYRWIRDGEKSDRVALTDAGRMALRSAQEQS